MSTSHSLIDEKLMTALEAARRPLANGGSFARTSQALLRVLELNLTRIKQAEVQGVIPSKLYKSHSSDAALTRTRGGFRVSNIPTQLRPLYKTVFEAKRWVDTHNKGKGQRGGRKSLNSMLDLLSSALKKAASATRVSLSNLPRKAWEELWELDTLTYMETHPSVCLVIWVVDERSESTDERYLSHFDEGDIALFRLVAENLQAKLSSFTEYLSDYKFEDRFRFVISSAAPKAALQAVAEHLGSVPIIVDSAAVKKEHESSLVDIKSDILISAKSEDMETFCRFAVLLIVDSTQAEERVKIEKQAQKCGVVVVKTVSTEKALKYLETHGFLGAIAPFRIVIGDDRRASAPRENDEPRASSSSADGDEHLSAFELVEIIRARLRWYTPILVYYEKKEFHNNDIYDFKSVRLTHDLVEAVEFASMKPIPWAPELSYFKQGENLSDKRGILKISSISCNDIAPKDSNGLSDPYVLLHVGDVKQKASKIMETLNPSWKDLNWEIHCKLTDKVMLDVWDWDRIGSHDFEGRTEFDLSQYMPFPLEYLEITRKLQQRTKDGKKMNEDVTGTLTVALGFESIEQRMQKSSTALQAQAHATKALGRHFGRPLEESLRVSNEAMELHLIDKAIAYIRSKSLKTQGIFRLPGNATSIERLRARIDGGDDVNFEIEDEHDVSSLLKMYFRELPDPLLPASCLPKFREAASIDDRNKRITHFSKLFCDTSTMPIVNRDVFIDLVHLLDEVASYEEVNMMTHRNLATCLAPTILIPHGIKASPVEVLTQTKTVTDLLEFVLVNHEAIFSDALSEKWVKQRKGSKELSQKHADKPNDKTTEGKTKKAKVPRKKSPRDRSDSVGSEKRSDSPREHDQNDRDVRRAGSLEKSSDKKTKSSFVLEDLVIEDVMPRQVDEVSPAPANGGHRRGLTRTGNTVVIPSPRTNENAPAIIQAAADMDGDAAEEDDEIARLERELREAELKEAELLRELEIERRGGGDSNIDDAGDEGSGLADFDDGFSPDDVDIH